MTAGRRFLPWLGAILSLPAALFALNQSVFYAWLNAADPQRWPAERAAPWSYGWLAAAVVLLVIFVASIVVLRRRRSA